MNYEQFINVVGYSSAPTELFLVFFVLAIWTLVWKGLALWRAAQNKSKPWFIVLLLVNTVGILEIAYIFFFSKKRDQTPING